MKSQKKNLIEVLERNKMFVVVKIGKATGKLTFLEQTEISSVIEYLVTVHGYREWRPFFTTDLDSLINPEKALDRFIFQEFFW